MTVLSVSTEVFACYSAACRPPTSGGTGGSGGGGKSGVKWAAGPPSAGGVKPSGGGAAGGGGSTTGTATYDVATKRVKADGKYITNRISKQLGGGYKATMSGAEFRIRRPDGSTVQRTVVGKTRAEVVDTAGKMHKELLARREVGTRRNVVIPGKGTPSQTTINRAKSLTAVQQLALKELGKTTPAKVSIGRDGSVKVNGKSASPYKISKGDRGYNIDGVVSRSGEYSKPTVFKDHAAVKRYIARQVNAVNDLLS